MILRYRMIDLLMRKMKHRLKACTGLRIVVKLSKKSFVAVSALRGLHGPC